MVCTSSRSLACVHAAVCVCSCAPVTGLYVCLHAIGILIRTKRAKTLQRGRKSNNVLGATEGVEEHRKGRRCAGY